MKQQTGRPMCPSAQPGMAQSQVLGLMMEGEGSKRLSYLNQKLDVTEEVMAMAAPLKATEVFRFAARCEESKCTHFDGQDCQLAKRIVQIMPAVVGSLPPCIIRANCRWYVQEGGRACLRCPGIATVNENPSELMKRVARGEASGAEASPGCEGWLAAAERRDRRSLAPGSKPVAANRQPRRAAVESRSPWLQNRKITLLHTKSDCSFRIAR